MHARYRAPIAPMQTARFRLGHIGPNNRCTVSITYCLIQLENVLTKISRLGMSAGQLQFLVVSRFKAAGASTRRYQADCCS